MADEVFYVWKGGALLGASPVWSVEERALYFVDIKGRFVHKVMTGTFASTSWSSPYPIGCIAPRAKGGWIAAHQGGIAFLDLSLRGKVSLTPIAKPESQLPGNRFNDGKCDAQGRFWAGSMDDSGQADSGSLYAAGADLNVRLEDSGYRAVNGPAFSPDGSIAYVTDSAKRAIYAFDAHDGHLSNKRVWRQFEEDEGHPGGMTTDAEGCLWIAFWDGWRVSRYDREGALMRSIRFPVARVTSCAFGGENLDRLYVTTAQSGLTPDALRDQPLAGGVFAVAPDVKGLPPHTFAG